MNEQQLFHELKKILTDRALTKIKESIVYKEPDGSVVLFDAYTIETTDSGYSVSKHKNEIISVSSLQVAVTYCTFDKRNMINQLLDIERLDRRLTDAEVNYQIHKRLSENSKNVEDRALYRIKMQEDAVKRKRMKEYLNTYINQAKHYQQKIFESLA